MEIAWLPTYCCIYAHATHEHTSLTRKCLAPVDYILFFLIKRAFRIGASRAFSPFILTRAQPLPHLPLTLYTVTFVDHRRHRHCRVDLRQRQDGSRYAFVEFGDCAHVQEILRSGPFTIDDQTVRAIRQYSYCACIHIVRSFFV